ncbi:hypothetical protein [Bradyrhizobium sp.]|uniref:hypothetical protein n=1 Tax=Bradyrhizobium sp. TaxID=376 RepID=UPI0025B96EC9|nr:hypothetical protein [Bradyrhizobium sp.]
MNRTGPALFAVAALVGSASLVPAYAAPPTVIPSPGYDLRLREQRAASRAVVQPPAPVIKPAKPRRAERAPAH